MHSVFSALHRELYWKFKWYWVLGFIYIPEHKRSYVFIYFDDNKFVFKF